ncbi:patatin-like phospholipase family protein [Streptomyces sp. NPDC002825]|uniref:patatin-like phospholipase family protein n=1 Tax=Streptomyces sp. NPDC002825 TaxID=3154666 RepID=UPI003326965F
MTQTGMRARKRTALVLGAGGLVGAGWETGVLRGLLDAGTDLTRADLVVGSSAGAVVAARLASGRGGLDALYEEQLDGEAAEPAARLGVPTILRYAVAVLRSRTPRSTGAGSAGSPSPRPPSPRPTVARPSPGGWAGPGTGPRGRSSSPRSTPRPASSPRTTRTAGSR